MTTSIHDNRDDDRGTGAEKVELEKRLDANREVQSDKASVAPASTQSGSNDEDEADHRSPSELGGPEYYAKDKKPSVPKIGARRDG